MLAFWLKPSLEFRTAGQSAGLQRILESVTVLMRAALALLLTGLQNSYGELPPNLQAIVDLADNSPEELLDHIKQSPLSRKLDEVPLPSAASGPNAALPTVTGHGMGDSCFEPGFASVTRAIAKRTGSYAKCIPTGGNIITDTINGYLMNMDKSVDVFAEKIQADPNLKGGFNAIGFSQGNSLIRGYIEKYNDPPVNTFISVHGTVMGVSALPGCFSQGKPLGLVCKAVAEGLGDLAYNSVVQGILFQAGYYRDPARTSSQAYLKHSQIAKWNNEDSTSINATYTSNFAKVKKFAMVKALKDSMVFPNEGEHWGSEPDGSFGTPLEMKDTKFYKDNLFGLKDADAANKIFYETTPGDHLQFTNAELLGWVDKYFLDKATDIAV
jgi:palmitoyl-protein thioesterase